MTATMRFQLAIAALSALFIAPPAQSDAKAPDATETHSIRRGGAVDEARYVRIGGIDQWIQSSGTNSANPVLLWLNGGPGGSTVRELSAIGSPPWRDDEAYQTVNRWANTLDPPSKVSSDVCAAERRVPPPAYIQAGAQFSSRLLSEAIGKEDLEAWAPHFALPVFFIQGRDDVLTTTSVVKAYVEKIQAPSKALIELPDSGHLAIFRDPDAFLAALKNRVRPLAMNSGR